ncbi:MAG: hypothetical protein IJT24_05520 [Lachnospiraceae bacterium]|nr:hypothetical protein [Lachnospiraceae bacterium]
MNGSTNRKLHTAVTVITIFIACMPLFTVNCIGGHDIAYHLLRIEALKTGILAGRPFLRVNMLFFGGMGYASSLFYPDLLLYFPALLRVFGVGINLAYHLFVALCVILGFASSFFCAKRVSGSSYAALVTAVVFTLYQYHLYDIYTRSAAGEYTAVIFIPFVIAGIYDYLYEEFRHPWFLLAGMSGVLLTHTITLVICLLLCLFAVLIDLKNIKSAPLKIPKLLLTAVLTLGVTAFYWMSVLEMYSTGAFSRDFTFDTAYEAAKLWELPFNEYNRMGAAIFILLLSGLVIREKESFANLCAIAGIVIAVCATGIFPWARLGGLLGFIQFPWRLFVITGPLLAFATGIYVSRLAAELGEGKEQGGSGYDGSRILLILVLAVMCVSAVSNYQHNTEKYYSYSDDYFDHIPFTAEVIGGEWLPLAAGDREALLEQAENAYTDQNETLEITRDKNELIIDDIPAGTECVDAPFIYYKGYAAENTETGESLNVSGEGRNGCVRVYTSGAGKVRVFYKGTVLQHTGDFISIGAIAGVLIYFLVGIMKRKGADGGDNDEG